MNLHLFFDDTYFEDTALCFYKGTGEDSGFIVKLKTHSTELWGIPQYGGEERFEKSWPGMVLLDAINEANTWS